MTKILYMEYDNSNKIITQQDQELIMGGTHMSRMPVIFIGHGSPMNAIDDNRFVRQWIRLGESLPRPSVIVSVSAHWFTNGTKIMTTEEPRMVYDMYGFPKELYEIKYSVKGSLKTADMIKKSISRNVDEDNSWGIDHGTWSVLCRMYPKADIPVVQLSVDANATTQEHYKMGQELKGLRDQGALLLGSGNIVHNLARVNWDMEENGYSWAQNFDQYIHDSIMAYDHDAVIKYQLAGGSASLAVPSMDHFAPLFYVLGASETSDHVEVINKSCDLGSLSMTSYIWN